MKQRQRPPFEKLDAETYFYFLRHGESEGNRDGRVQGHHDYPLSETGKEHARAAARWLAERGIDAVYSSPLSRAMQTARIVARASDISRTISRRNLMELDTGIFSGLSFGEMATNHPEEFDNFRVHSWNAVPGAERTEALYARALAHWNELIEAARSDTTRILSVTHGGLIQWLLKVTFGDPQQQWMPLIPASNCGIFLFVAQPVFRNERTAQLSSGAADGYMGEWRIVNFVPYQNGAQA